MQEPRLVRRLRRQARDLGTRAIDGFLASPDRAEAVSAAVRRVQAGRRAIDGRAAKIISSFGFATAHDLEPIERKLGRLRKRAQAILDRLDQG